jgi:salicylate hydroxylase
MRSRTIAVAGCGIAGLACAALLARKGHRVTVFDRLDAPRPLGSGLILQPVGLAVLDAIGIGARIRQLGAPIERLFGKVQPSGRVVLDVRYRALGAGKPPGLAVHRGALFQVLFDAAIAAGAEMTANREVTGTDGDGRLAFSDGQTSARFDLVVDALGVQSRLAHQAPIAPLPYGALWASLDWPEGAGFDPEALEQRYQLARRMVGVLPIGHLPGSERKQAAFFWSLKHAEHLAWRERGLEAWKADVLNLWPETSPLLAQINAPDQLIFASYSHATRASPLSRGVIHIGDSWHCASPQLGQGANMALLDALALALAVDANRDIEAAGAAYRQARLGHIRLYQLASWSFTPAYQSDSAFLAWLRDWIVAPVSRIWPGPPLLAALVAGAIGAPLQRIAKLGGEAPPTLPTAAAPH